MKTKGFTLIELILVIGIIGLLLALSVPALTKAREQARSIRCCSTLWQIGTGFRMYQSEHNSFPPAFAPPTSYPNSPPGGYIGNAAYDRIGWWWFHFLADYLSKISPSETALYCPSRTFAEPEVMENFLCGNYGANVSIVKYLSGEIKYSTFSGKALNISQLTYPEEKIMVFDAGYVTINWRQATDPPVPLGSSREDVSYVPGLSINAQRSVWPGMEDDAVNGRHWNKNVNIGFADGHVTTQHADTLLVIESDGKYQNRSLLWQP